MGWLCILFGHDFEERIQTLHIKGMPPQGLPWLVCRRCGGSRAPPPELNIEEVG